MNSVALNLDNLTENERTQLFGIIEKANAKKRVHLSDIKNGETFKIGDFEFIKFFDENGITTTVTKDVVFNSSFGDNNNFAESEVLSRLNNEFMPKVIEAIGEENVCDIETDLTALDGLKAYGKMNSCVSLPTLDFYRANVEIFDKYKLDAWWWLATPHSVKLHYDPDRALCVSPSGRVSYRYYSFVSGVRPFCRFVSSIFVSNEE